MSYTNKKDDFGRDIELRNQQSIAVDDYINNLKNLLSTMSWAEFHYAQDEEEERLEAEKAKKMAEKKAIQAKEDAIKTQKFDAQKRDQMARGNYELEEGEIIE